MTFSYTPVTGSPGLLSSGQLGDCGLIYQPFLGSDIQGLTLKLGYGKSETELNLELIESVGPFDQSISGCYVTTYSGELGHIYTFNLGDAFIFHGILQDHDIQLDSGGRKISVRLSDGRQYLNNAIVIIGKYYGRSMIYSDCVNNSVNSINILNALYEIEPGVHSQFYTDGCPDNNYDKCSYFMLSGADKDGMPAYKALTEINGKFLTLPLTNQTLQIDVSQLIALTASRGLYIRLSGSHITILNLIETICNDIGCEYYIYIDKIIVDSVEQYTINIKPIDKTQGLSDQFSLRDYLTTNYVGTNNFLSLNYGQETTYEPTRQIVFGSQYRYFVEIEQTGQFPIFPPSWNSGFGDSSAPSSTDSPAITGIAPSINTPIKIQTISQVVSGQPCGGTGVFDGLTCNHFGGGRICMLLGEKLNLSSDSGIPGTYKLYFSNLCQDIINIEYDITDLLASLGLSGPPNSALLTQEELLMSENYETYFNWCLDHNQSIGYIVGQKIYGPTLWGKFQTSALQMLKNILAHQNFDAFKDHGLNQFNTKIASKQFELVHKYVRDIYENYYGKEYIVLLDKQTSAPLNLHKFDICLKQSYNVNPVSPNINIPNNTGIASGIIHSAIKTAGQNGTLVTSDKVTNGAWFAGPADNAILDLAVSNGALNNYVNDDNTIAGFIKYGPYRNICKRIGNKTYKFRVDLGSLDPADVYFQNDEMYIKATFREEMYFANWFQSGTLFTDDNTWVRFSIPQIKLVPELLDETAEGRAASAAALIALRTMITSGTLARISGGEKLETVLKDAFAGGGVKSGVFDGAISNLSITNLAKISTPAIVPKAVAIPFESNTMIYGPWGYTANLSGGIEVIETDLNPWSFGLSSLANVDGWNLMNNAANALAQNATRGRIYQERGSVNFAGIPDINIGSALGANDNVILTDITMNYGSNGATTSLTFQTYSPKFGSAAKYLVDATKETIANRAQFLKEIRTESLKRRSNSLQLLEAATKFGRRSSSRSQSAVEPYDYSKVYQASPTKILISAYQNPTEATGLINYTGGADDESTEFETHNYTGCEDVDTDPPRISSSPASNQGNKLRRFPYAEIHPTYNFDFAQAEYYKNMSMMSLDGFFLPVSVDGGPNNNLARLADYSSKIPGSTLPKDRPVHAMPPIEYTAMDDDLNDINGSTFDLDINQKYLNPITSSGMLLSWGTRKNESTDGFVIINIAYGTGIENNFNFDTIETTGGDILQNRQSQEDFRFSALRGPLMLQSWGYDINGKPIPNANDSAAAAESGIFRQTGLQDKFLKNWLSNPKTWPVAPVDLRFDRHRGVWVAPTNSKMIVARLKTTLSAYGTAEAELLNPSAGGIQYYEDYELYGENGENLKTDIRNATVTVHEYLGNSIGQCALVLLYYEDGKYIVIEEASQQMVRARISENYTLSCGGTCMGELISITAAGGITYGDTASITIADTLGIVPQALSGGTRLWTMKMRDSDLYEVVFIGTREGANCGSCGGFGVYSIAGLDFNRLPTVAEVGSPLTVTPGGCLAKVNAAACSLNSTSP